ncbi:ABC transporter substrate-binding protein [uncultured Methylobacterium sp.]|uniref:ABC transporter substrate-binding protein n=1 Tax=uncultured Methylobacterium sp. TaxID=157278 RepID=UPI0035CA2517
MRSSGSVVAPMWRRIAASLLAFLWAIAPARAEVSELRIARQYGISHLQMALLEHFKLIERHATDVGLPDLKVSWTRFSDGPGMNEALLSGNLDIANGGLTALIVLFDKSRGAYTGLAPLSAMPAILMMRRPGVRSVADLNETDRIALVSRVSMQAIILRMFAQKALGKDKATVLDALTVPLPHAEAMAALIAGKSEITGHFTAAPFYQIEEAKGLNRILNSYDVLGGPATYSVTWAARRFMSENPTVIKAVLAAIEDATRIIHDDPKRASEAYIAAEGSSLDPALVERIIRDPENIFTTTPQKVMTFVDFMAESGTVKQPPKSWKDLFPLLQDKGGS